MSASTKPPRIRRPWTLTPYFTPDRDDDPLGVYLITPVHQMLTELYFKLDPETDDDFQDQVHGENEAVSHFIAHACNNHDALVDALISLLPHAGSVLSGTIAGEELLLQARAVLNAARPP